MGEGLSSCGRTKGASEPERLVDRQVCLQVEDRRANPLLFLEHETALLIEHRVYTSQCTFGALHITTRTTPDQHTPVCISTTHEMAFRTLTHGFICLSIELIHMAGVMTREDELEPGEVLKRKRKDEPPIHDRCSKGHLDLDQVDGLTQPRLGSQHSGVQHTAAGGNDLTTASVNGVSVQHHIVDLHQDSEIRSP